MSTPALWYDIIAEKENPKAICEGTRGWLFVCTEEFIMSYRKVGPLENVWYIIRYKIRGLFSRKRR